MDTQQLDTQKRRTVLAVPGSNPKMLAKARTLPADEIFFDLEDAVAIGAKEESRANIVAALNAEGWGSQARAVRVNDWSTPYTYGDLIEVVSGAGARIDSILLPKVSSAAEVTAIDLLLTQLEANLELMPGRIKIQALIENAVGIRDINAIASASSRLVSLVLGPGDMMASLGMRSLIVGEQPTGYTIGDAHHHVLMSILVAARAHGLQAIDGPFVQLNDEEALLNNAHRSAALGYDGKWVIHPNHIAAVNEVFTPSQEQYDAAEELLSAYDMATSVSGGTRGAVRYRGEMIDEASKKMAESIAAKGRAAGLTREKK